MTNDDVNLVRRVLCWGFAALSLIHSQVVVREIRYILDGHHTHQFHWLVIMASLSFAVIILSALAWWTLWKSRTTAKVWAIAGSVMQIVVFIVSVILPSRAGTYHWEALLIGTIGVVIFSWPLPLTDSHHNSEVIGSR